MVLYNYGETWSIYGRYDSDDTFRYTVWRSGGALWENRTEWNSWNYFYYPRHYPYKNIASGNKIYDLGFYWTGDSANRIWAYVRLYQKESSFVRYDGYDSHLSGRYEPKDTFRYVHWRSNGTLYNDYTERTDWWTYYNPRHYPYENISTGDKINDLGNYWTGNGTDRIWALYFIWDYN